MTTLPAFPRAPRPRRYGRAGLELLARVAGCWRNRPQGRPSPPARPPLPGSLKVAPSWIPGSESTPTAIDHRLHRQGRAGPGHQDRAAASRGGRTRRPISPSSRSSPPIPVAHAERGLHRRQPFDAGQRHRDHECRGAGARNLLIDAAQRLGSPADQLKTEKAACWRPMAVASRYGDLVAGCTAARRGAAAIAAERSRLLHGDGQSPMPRVDIPAKVTGGAAYVQDLRLPRHGARAAWCARRATARDSPRWTLQLVEKMPGVVKVVRDGNFLAVVAEREFQAIKAMRALAAAAQWAGEAQLPNARRSPGLLMACPQDIDVLDQRQPGGSPAQISGSNLHASVSSHGSIGPSCAVAQLENGAMTVWTHTQGVYPDRRRSQMLRMPKEQVRCIHMRRLWLLRPQRRR